MSDRAERVARRAEHLANVVEMQRAEIERLQTKEKELRGTLIELRLRLHAQGRRSPECHELHMIDEALWAGEK